MTHTWNALERRQEREAIARLFAEGASWITVLGAEGLGKSWLLERFRADTDSAFTIVDDADTQLLQTLAEIQGPVLAAGRDVIGISREAVLALAPFRPGARPTSWAEALTCPCTAMLLRSALDVEPDWRPQALELGPLQELAMLVDGVPLALAHLGRALPALGLDAVEQRVRASLRTYERHGRRVVRATLVEAARGITTAL